MWFESGMQRKASKLFVFLNRKTETNRDSYLETAAFHALPSQSVKVIVTNVVKDVPNYNVGR